MRRITALPTQTPLEVETSKQFVLHGIAAGGAVPRRLYGI